MPHIAGCKTHAGFPIQPYPSRKAALLALKRHYASLSKSDLPCDIYYSTGGGNARSSEVLMLLSNLQSAAQLGFQKVDAIKSNIAIGETSKTQTRSDKVDQAKVYIVSCKVHDYRDVFTTEEEAETAASEHDLNTSEACDWLTGKVVNPLHSTGSSE